MRKRISGVLLAITAVALVSCTSDGEPPPAADDTTTASPSSSPARGTLSNPETMATGLEVPWGLTFLPDGDALIAERPTGRILRIRPGGRPEQVMRISGVNPDGEGGLLGLAVSPTYARDGLVYAYCTASRDNRIVRFRLGGSPSVILDGIDRAGNHNGGRLAFGPDGMLYATTGDAGDAGTAQDRGSLNGKILRLRPDGSVPPDNPFTGSAVWSYGHRNVQGITWDAQGRMWASEFGASTFDELNLIRKGANYGWPAVEGRGDTNGGRFTNPVVTWRTEEASPSGIAFWRGSLYLAALRGERLWRVSVEDNGDTGTPASLFRDRYGRLRSVAVAPDGSLWLGTSNRDGRGDVRRGDDRVVRFR